MEASSPPEDFQVVQVGVHVQVELICETGPEELEFDLTPDEQADFAHGLLGESTPLAKAILGLRAGEVAPYHKGDIRAIKILRITLCQVPHATAVKARREEALRQVVEQVERTNAINFASSYTGKWGDYDPGAIEE